MFLETTSIELKLAFRKANKNDLLDKSICLWTKSKYCHVEIIIDNLWISSNIDNGVHIKDYYPITDIYDYYSLRAIVIKDHYTNIIEWINNQNGKDYDKLGILMTQILPFRLDSRNKWFCSELVCKILQMFNIKEVENNYPFLTSPGDLAKIFKVE